MFCRQRRTLSCRSTALTVRKITVIQTGVLLRAQGIADRIGQPIFHEGVTVSADEVAFVG